MPAAFEIPKGITVHQLPHSMVWYNGGVVYIVKREHPQSEANLSFNQIKAEIHALRSVIGDKRVCILAQDRQSPVSEKEQEKFVAEQFSEFTSAMAILTESKLKARCLNVLLPFLNKMGYPVKYFNKESKAIAWLNSGKFGNN